MTMVESIRNYVKTFPKMNGERLNVDFLSEEEQEYAIEIVPSQTIVKRYLDGSSVRQILFLVASRMFYGPDLRQQIDNQGFFEEFQDWIDTNSLKGIFPALSDGQSPRKIEVTTSGYAFLPGEDTARYQIQCRLEYFQAV